MGSLDLFIYFTVLYNNCRLDQVFIQIGLIKLHNTRGNILSSSLDFKLLVLSRFVLSKLSKQLTTLFQKTSLLKVFKIRESFPSG